MHRLPSNPTEQLVHALEEYPIDILAHPSGPLINEREPPDLDMDAVMHTRRTNSASWTSASRRPAGAGVKRILS